jgi:hypothetical protein
MANNRWVGFLRQRKAWNPVHTMVRRHHWALETFASNPNQPTIFNERSISNLQQSSRHYRQIPQSSKQIPSADSSADNSLTTSGQSNGTSCFLQLSAFASIFSHSSRIIIHIFSFLLPNEVERMIDNLCTQPTFLFIFFLTISWNNRAHFAAFNKQQWHGKKQFLVNILNPFLCWSLSKVSQIELQMFFGIGLMIQLWMQSGDRLTSLFGSGFWWVIVVRS